MPAIEHAYSSSPRPSVYGLLACAPNDPEPTTGSDRRTYSALEDEILIALDMRAMLEASGHVVVGIADSADRAIATALRERPDLVLMDIALVGSRDGIDAAIELRARLDIPSLFITAHPDPTLRERARTAKPLGFLAKPLDEDVLLRLLAQL
jgi:two-component system, response regulator PdtaR